MVTGQFLVQHNMGGRNLTVEVALALPEDHHLTVGVRRFAVRFAGRFADGRLPSSQSAAGPIAVRADRAGAASSILCVQMESPMPLTEHGRQIG
jgi:hypothetical protein